MECWRAMKIYAILPHVPTKINITNIPLAKKPDTREIIALFHYIKIKK